MKAILNVIMLNVVMLNVVMLNAMMLNVVILNAMNLTIILDSMLGAVVNCWYYNKRNLIKLNVGWNIEDLETDVRNLYRYRYLVADYRIADEGEGMVVGIRVRLGIGGLISVLSYNFLRRSRLRLR